MWSRALHASEPRLGETRPAVLSCPQCSYLLAGTCVVCEDGDAHPACDNCANGRLLPPPWYKRDLFLAIATSTLVAVTSTIIIAEIRRTRLLK